MGSEYLNTENEAEQGRKINPNALNLNKPEVE
jgi:hypothetical protein